MINIKILYYFSSVTTYLYYLYLYQLKGYFYTRFLKHIYKNKLVLFNLSLFGLSILINTILSQYNSLNIHLNINNLSKIKHILFIIFNSIILFTYIIIFTQKLIENKKIKFKITSKILRNILIFSILTILLLIYNINFIYLIFFTYLFVFIIDFLDLYKYFEKIYFYIKTKNYIKNNPQIIRIGITGSNGKTSIKNILYTLIKDYINTVVTPKNFNTPKGIKYTVCKLCNSNTQCIIFEMGARRKNDILSLCRLTDVNMGILSNISSQHIETFKSIENVYSTKCELPNYLGKNCCVYNFNDPLSLKAYKQKEGKKLLVGIVDFYKKLFAKKEKYPTLFHTKNKKKIVANLKIITTHTIPIKFDLIAKNVAIKNGLTQFTIIYKNQSYICETQLLGKHNISNILQAMAIALELKIDISLLIHKTATLQPVPHRLELIKTKINILDDSYNCSILSAKNSLEVLASFSNQKICCTPGIIEGGTMQEELNIKLAKMLKKYTNIQIIVGKTNRLAFQKVLDKKSAYFVDTLNDAKKLFSLAKVGDTLLLLNDLPDDYN